jgi:sugar phosphate isomerase/epimerase
MNITTGTEDTSRYLDNADLKSFYRRFGLDGLEVMQIGGDGGQILRNDDVIGFHLKYFTSWMDLWMGDTSRLLEEFGDIETVKQVFGGITKDALIEAYKRNLDFAATMLPEYLVFHVSDCTMRESMKRQYHYSDGMVVEAAAELVNCITDFIQGTPMLLFENLWYPGLTMTSPDITNLLLDKVNYSNKGFMLDIGHLLHTNMNLGTIESGVDYILSVLEQYKDISFIKGIHLSVELLFKHVFL